MLGRESSRERGVGSLFLHILRWWAPLIIYMGLIFWLSSGAVPLVLKEAPDYILHFGGYFVMGILAVRAFAGGLAEPPRRLSVWCGLMFSLIYAATDEWHQSYVPGRVASRLDLVADGLGILAAWLGLNLYWRILRTGVAAHDSKNR